MVVITRLLNIKNVATIRAESSGREIHHTGRRQNSSIGYPWEAAASRLARGCAVEGYWGGTDQGGRMDICAGVCPAGRLPQQRQRSDPPNCGYAWVFEEGKLWDPLHCQLSV